MIGMEIIQLLMQVMLNINQIYQDLIGYISLTNLLQRSCFRHLLRTRTHQMLAYQRTGLGLMEGFQIDL